MSNDIKKRLIEELSHVNLSTVEMAKKVGVSPEMITQYTTTKKLPKLDTFAKLCIELDLEAEYILGIKTIKRKRKPHRIYGAVIFCADLF